MYKWTLILLSFLTAIFFLGCKDILEPPKQVKPGQGYFSLAIDGADTSRTIMPSYDVTGDFAGFTLKFEGVDGTADRTVERTDKDISEPVLLDAGKYDLVVSAFFDAAKTKPVAVGELTGIEINGGALTRSSIELKPIGNGDEGTFRWEIVYPETVTTAAMTVTPLNGGTEEKTWYFEGGTPETSKDSAGENASLLLASGYYRVVFRLQIGNTYAERREILHVYQNMVSFFDDGVFTADHFYNNVIFVTSKENAGGGSLRQAIADIPTGGRIVVSPGVKTIALEARLEIASAKTITIDGNGVALTKAESWDTVDNNSQLMYVTNASANVTVSRVWFKDGRATNNGGAIYKNAGTMTLESCIFSGNRTSNGGSFGGAIYNNGGTLNIRGCTFYNNEVPGAYGQAIGQVSGTLTLTGNLFYGNSTGGSVIYRSGSGTVTSSGYNVSDRVLVDVSSGTYTPNDDDKTITVGVLPVSLVSFRPLSGRGVDNVIDTLPANYPPVDFYGNPITNGAAVGAVQGTASGYHLTFTVNYSDRGTISTNPPPDADGCYSGTVEITATPNGGNFTFSRWLVNGTNVGKTNPLQLTLTEHTQVQAVFERLVLVTKFTDETDSATTAGTLRHAITNAQNEDIIRIGTAGETIPLGSRLPTITRSITIEGNGVTLTRDESWTTVDGESQMMFISNASAVVTVSRVWFKDGRAENYSGAIRINYGTVNLESCIFSGNRATAATYAYGGAIRNDGTLNVKGCTFYDNSAVYSGGVIYNYSSSSVLTLTGNLFYGNTATTYPVVYPNGTRTSYGYNVVDVALGTGSAQSGFVAVDGDKSIGVGIINLPVSPVSLRLISNGPAANVIDILPEDYPKEDFYGTAIAANGAAAGAVQTVSGGYGFAASSNNNAYGNISTTAAPDAEGLYSGTVTITAVPAGGCVLARWLVNNTETAGTGNNTLQLTLAGNTNVQAVFIRVFIVDNFSDADGSATVPGTLRHAITNALNGDIIRLSEVTSGQDVIRLTSRLPTITRGITIEGNGVTITRDDSWTTVDANSQLMYINSGTATVTISRVWFKDGRATTYGGAILSNGTVNLESCIFSGNRSTAGTTQNVGGGAITNGGTLNVRGCTFYQNSTTGTGSGTGGGAILSTSTLTLTGNLFYGNTAPRNPVVYLRSGTVTSGGYNVSDVALGTGTAQSGWTADASDKTINALPISPTSFRLLSGSGAAGVIATRPADYPAGDFYGTAIPTTNAAAGAVQSTASGGYALELSENYSGRGNISTTATPDQEGLYSGTVEITATLEGSYELLRWIVNGTNAGNTNPLQLEMTGHMRVRALLGNEFVVTNFTSDAATTAGTLRYAITNAQDGDIVRIGTAGQTITVGSRLPDITRSITIEGNGVTITRATTYTASATSQLMYINSATAEVNIGSVWFKDGRATDYGALRINAGTLNLESCIFSGNQASVASASGGAIYKTGAGVLNVKGCTFYNNSCPNNGYGGAIYVGNNSTLTLTGNLFYGNTAVYGPAVRRATNGTATSNGYNIADVAIGTANDESGFAAATGDQQYTTNPFSSTTTLAPTAAVRAFIPQTWGQANMPVTDFNGAARTWPGAAGAVR